MARTNWERCFREPTRFFKNVVFTMGTGPEPNGALGQTIAAIGKIASLAAIVNSATAGAVTTTVTLAANTLMFVTPQVQGGGTGAGKILRVVIKGQTAANGNTKRVDFTFGTTTVTLFNAAANNKDFYADITIYQTANAAQQICVSGYANSAIINALSTTSTQNQTAAIALAVVLTAATGAADIILQEFTVYGEA